MEAVCSSETSVYIQRATRRYIPEDSTLHTNLVYSLRHTYFNIILPSTPVSPKWYLPFNIFRRNVCMDLLFPPWMLHTLPIVSSVIWSPQYYLDKCTNYVSSSFCNIFQPTKYTHQINVSRYSSSVKLKSVDELCLEGSWTGILRLVHDYSYSVQHFPHTPRIFSLFA
jgi:hypothetical protein